MKNVKNLIQEVYGGSKKHIKERGKDVNGKKKRFDEKEFKRKIFLRKDV